MSWVKLLRTTDNEEEIEGYEADDGRATVNGRIYHEKE